MAPLMWKDEAPNPIENKSDVIFYLVFGGFVLIGLIASIKVLRFKLIFQTNKKTKYVQTFCADLRDTLFHLFV